MRVLITSDWHAEFYQNTRWLEKNLPNRDSYDIVLAVGDIHTWTNGITKLQSFFKKPVFVTFGNHEYYGHSYQDLRYMFIGANYDNVKLLLGGDHSDYEFEGKTYRIIGATLWTTGYLEGFDTSPQYIEQSIADFKLIQYGKHRMNLDLMRQICNQEKRAIDDALTESTADHNIVMTHFMPTVEACKRGSYDGDKLNPYFATECDSIMDIHSDKIDLWAFGHTHDRMEFNHPDNGVHLISNPLGYPGEIKTPYEWRIINVG